MADDLTPLDAARAIGRQLCSSAEWQRGRCTWREGSELLDGDLYAGTAGVAWFLAGLAGATGDEDARRTARGAMEHALTVVAGREQLLPGLHGGDLGVLWAAAELGEALNDLALAARARELVEEVAVRLSGDRDGRADVMSGLAGTALALVALGARDMLADAGTGLLAAAEPAPVGAAWPEAGGPEGASVRSVGLAHGAAGVAWALSELAEATGERSLRDAALEGLAFERTWFDAEACTWRDPETGSGTGSSWCRGSAGSAMVRLRVLTLAHDTRLAAETGAAVASVHGAVAAALAGPEHHLSWEQANYSVCHGLMGAADVLLEAADVLGVPEHRRAAERIAERGIATTAAKGAWPCGTIDGSPSVGLMLGLAGIGSVLLRVERAGALPTPGLLGYSTSAAKGCCGSSR